MNYDHEFLVVIEVNMNNSSFTQNELVQEDGDSIHFGNPLDSWVNDGLMMLQSHFNFKFR